MDLIEKAALKAQQQQKEKKPSVDTSPASEKNEPKKAVSLVERAALKSGNNPFKKAEGATGIGALGERKPDPSSLNPFADNQSSSQSFKGIGAPGSKPRPKPAANEDDKPKKPDEDTKPRSLAIGAGGTTAAGKAAKPKKQKPPQEIDLVALREGGYITPDMPPNLMSEEFRIIKRSLLLTAFSKDTDKNRNSNVLLVTSSNPSEGKTFCTINLALSIATEQDVTVLLVDADFSKPEILNRLGVSGGRGLMDVVADNSLDLADCLVRTNVPNLVLLPAGRQHNLTTELLASERMEKIVEEISTRYPDRLVIFDSPPVLASSAASVMALYMGQVVFVIEAEKTTEPQIKESLGMVSACENINLLLNKTRYNGSNKKFATYYGYGGR
ncbi:XrtA-associated tyrosine autokinase [Kordiimonas aquimaris]|uniref:XrtA-associated tyrosine autokinase n=1 Tax=Kordiimonas aquimaris TaxID=707591 RepID=UPI0021D25924|nr:XrtA-associated tyrosine autokinase [Kordiimonas aquimaris]